MSTANAVPSVELDVCLLSVYHGIFIVALAISNAEDEERYVIAAAGLGQRTETLLTPLSRLPLQQLYSMECTCQ